MDRPLLTSVTPPLEHGAHVVLGFCACCGTVKAFAQEKHGRFPDTGYWTECRACQQYQYFFRIDRGRVVNTGHIRHY